MDFNENSAQSRVVPKAKTLLSSTREHWPRAKPYSHFSPLLLLKSLSHRDKKKNLGFPISIASPIPTEARDEESKDVHCCIVRHRSPIGGRVPSLLRIRCRAQPRILRLVGQRRLRPSSLFASSEQLKSFLSPLVRICVVISIFI